MHYITSCKLHLWGKNGEDYHRGNGKTVGMNSILMPGIIQELISKTCKTFMNFEKKKKKIIIWLPHLFNYVQCSGLNYAYVLTTGCYVELLEISGLSESLYGFYLIRKHSFALCQKKKWINKFWLYYMTLKSTVTNMWLYSKSWSNP